MNYDSPYFSVQSSTTRGIRLYSIIIENSQYERCESRPLSERVDEIRWRMFSHILRSDDNYTPANVSLVFFKYFIFTYYIYRILSNYQYIYMLQQSTFFSNVLNIKLDFENCIKYLSGERSHHKKPIISNHNCGLEMLQIAAQSRA